MQAGLAAAPYGSLPYEGHLYSASRWRFPTSEAKIGRRLPLQRRVIKLVVMMVGGETWRIYVGGRKDMQQIM